MKPSDCAVVIARNDSSDLYHFPEMTELELQSELWHLVECGATELLVFDTVNGGCRRFTSVPRTLEETPWSPPK